MRYWWGWLGIPLLITTLIAFPRTSESVKAVDLPSKDVLLRLTWEANGQAKELSSWDLKRIQTLPRMTRAERDPITQELVQWQGVDIRELLEEALKELDLQQRSHVDLIVLKSRLGQHGFFPRSFVRKFPVMVALRRNGEELGPRGPIYSVVPWTRPDPKFEAEILPVQKFFVSGVEEIVLSNYRQFYREEIFVKRRTDPLVIRGEKRFVQTCMGCHTLKRLPPVNELANKVLSPGLLEVLHSNVKGVPEMKGIERMAIRSYLRELQISEPGLALNASK